MPQGPLGFVVGTTAGPGSGVAAVTVAAKGRQGIVTGRQLIAIATEITVTGAETKRVAIPPFEAVPIDFGYILGG